MPAPKSGFQFDTGINVGPFFAQSLIDAMLPRALQKQHAEQVALAKLVEMQPTISKMPDEEKKNFYNHFFQSFGVYRPGWIRSIFGAGDEPVLPLPEGTTETSEFKKGLFGVGGGMQRQIITPERKPFSFPQEPFLSIQHENELRTSLEKMGWSKEDINDTVARAREKKFDIWGTSTPALESRIYGRAARFIQDEMAQGATLEQAETKLEGTKPEVAALYRKFKEEADLRKRLKEATITKGVEDTAIKQQEADRKKLEGDRRDQMAQATLQFKREVSIRTAQNVRDAMLFNNEAALNRAANTAYATYMRGVLAHNERERRMANDARYSGVPYLPQIQDLMDEKMWLRSEEGMPFANKLNALPGGGGVTETPLPMQRIDKINKFEQKHGIRR